MRGRRGRGTILRELQKLAEMADADFNDVNDVTITYPDGHTIRADAFIKERTRLWRETWMLPLIKELQDKER